MHQIQRFAYLTIGCLLLSGCAEGPLWQLGNYSPWAREKWEAEEQVADTYFKRKKILDQKVEDGKTGSQASKTAVVRELEQLVKREPILLVRLHAVQSLRELPCQAAAEALQAASKDPDGRIRVAAAHSLAYQPAEYSVPILQELLGSDTDVDVRLAATEALGATNSIAAAQALAVSLTDSNPAVQLKATESLANVSGQDFGANVAAWQSFLESNGHSRVAVESPHTKVR